MAAAHRISEFDLVELTEAVEGAPVGARGGVTDILDPDRMIVELTSLPPEPILERIVIVSPDKLRLVEPAPGG
jgi:hypothetical protein